VLDDADEPTPTSKVPDMTDESPSATPPSRPGGQPRQPGRKGRLAPLRRRLSGAAALGLALGAVGVGYTAIAAAAAPHRAASAVAAQNDPIELRKGRRIYEEGCIACHGTNLEGVPYRGPSLVGVGQAAVYFQVVTGRMPAARQEAQIPRKPPQYGPDEAEQVAAYIQAVAGGPQIPQGNLRDGDLAEGGELFRLNCASCHNFAGRGGALSAGKSAPSLSDSSDAVIYAAMLSGPQNMPVFSDNQLTPDQKRAIVNYVQTLKQTHDPGGSGIGRLGPLPEGLVIWVIGVGGLMLIILWIGAKS
jgi:ubiquinol-cytochrome c reductase cytochrome c subunit